MMDNDDRQVGRILSRREALAVLGVAGAGLLAACTGLDGAGQNPTAAPTQILQNDPALAPAPTGTTARESLVMEPTASPAASTATPMCVVRPELTEGPYFVDELLLRSDIRSDPADGSVREGVPLQLTIHVSQVGNQSCTPLAGATVDLWHCDALGIYSGVQDPGFNTAGSMFLRGAQVTDANGAVQFTTIYPGWYQGRTVHIHFKIRTDPDSAQGQEFTSQFFFDDVISDQVFTQEPYAGNGPRRVRNEDDGIYRAGGDQLLLSLTQSADGYAATFDIGLQLR